jgi:hypothetical protein
VQAQRLQPFVSGMRKMFCHTKASKSVLSPTQPYVQCDIMDLLLRVKRTEREGDHSSPSIADTETAWSSTYASCIPLWSEV